MIELTLGEKLLRIRRKRKLTRQALGQHAGLTAVDIFQIESGIIIPNVKELDRLSCILEIDIFTLIDTSYMLALQPKYGAFTQCKSAKTYHLELSIDDE